MSDESTKREAAPVRLVYVNERHCRRWIHYPNGTQEHCLQPAVAFLEMSGERGVKSWLSACEKHCREALDDG